MTPAQFDAMYDMMQAMVRHEVRRLESKLVDGKLHPNAAWSQEGTIRERHEACARAKAALVEHAPEDNSDDAPYERY